MEKSRVQDNLDRLRALHDTREEDLTGYRHDLFIFEATFKAQVARDYPPLIKANPLIFEYANTYTKLTKIFALPYKLTEWTTTHDVSHLQQADCRAILVNHDRYPVLFKPCAYLDARGFQHDPTFGKWRHDGQEYKLFDLITRVSRLTSSLIADPCPTPVAPAALASLTSLASLASPTSPASLAMPARLTR
jgi:hypothetical protein